MAKFAKGQSGNPGGMPKDARAAADALNAWLRSDAVADEGKEAYLALLEDRNPIITKDFMDRVAGKARDVVLLEDATDPLKKVPTEKLVAALDKLLGDD